MSVQIENLIPASAQVSIDIHLSAAVNVTAFSARQKVTGFVVDQISTNMHAINPTLIMGERIFWRVPIVLSLPPVGDIGEVGVIDVDVESGQLQITPTLVEEIERHAEFLAANTPSSPTT